MAFRNGAAASVWEIIPAESGNYCDVRVTTTHKRQDTGGYEQDFTGKVRFIGEANLAIRKYPHSVEEGSTKAIVRIRLDDVSATVTKFTPKDAEKPNWYHNYQCYKFTPADIAYGNKDSAPAPTTQKPLVENIPEDIDEELPFA